MSIATIHCPRCSSPLRTAKPFGAGSRFRCPGCGFAFAVGPLDAPSSAFAGGPDPGVRPLPPPPDDDAPRRSHGWLILLGLVGLALLLLAGAGAALVVHFLPKRESPPVAAGSVRTTPPAPSADPPAQLPQNAPPHIPDNSDPPRNHPPPPDQPPPLAPPEPPVQSVLPPEEQDKVNAAIDRGVAFLKKTQLADGSWAQAHAVGLAALPGLTLLECGVPADDPHVQKAAEFVRREVPNLTATYELGLAILFLDRLGDPKDEPLIQTMALRLMAGQSPAGGWTYQCPLLKEKEEQNLRTILEATRPRSSLDLVTTKSGDKGIDDLFTSRSGDRPEKSPGGTMALSAGPTEEERKEAKKLYDKLSADLKAIPALKPPTKDDEMPAGDKSDNSNTQFATLGLWAAGRHGVPMERALDLLARRFQVSQTPGGGWAYHYQPHPGGGETPTMTGAGLLGLAVGHGVTADLKGVDVQAAAEDPQVEKGMKALGEHIGLRADPALRRKGPRGVNYYLLWSVERVGMLYGRKTIGDKEWYPWGAEELVDSQGDDGSWPRMYEPPTDTCLALLFLKRANLAKDLSTKLQFLTQVKKP